MTMVYIVKDLRGSIRGIFGLEADANQMAKEKSVGSVWFVEKHILDLRESYSGFTRWDNGEEYNERTNQVFSR